MSFHLLDCNIYVLCCFIRKFEELSEAGEKVGEPSKALQAQLAALQAETEDTSCGMAEEGQDNDEMLGNNTMTLEPGDSVKGPVLL
jgi:hypothetical protein